MEERMLAREEQREIEFRKKMEKFSHLKENDPLRKEIEGFRCSCGNGKFRGEVFCSRCYWLMEWGDRSPDLPEEEES